MKYFNYVLLVAITFSFNTSLLTHIPKSTLATVLKQTPKLTSRFLSTGTQSIESSSAPIQDIETLKKKKLDDIDIIGKTGFNTLAAMNLTVVTKLSALNPFMYPYMVPFFKIAFVGAAGLTSLCTVALIHSILEFRASKAALKQAQNNLK